MHVVDFQINFDCNLGKFFCMQDLVLLFTLCVCANC